MRFSKSTQSFYPKDIHYPNPPDDLVDITHEEHHAALNRAPGETLDVVEGKLVILPAPAPDPAEVLSTAKANALAQINTLVQDQHEKAAGTTSPAETLHWPHKLRIAQGILAELVYTTETTRAAEAEGSGLSLKLWNKPKNAPADTVALPQVSEAEKNALLSEVEARSITGETLESFCQKIVAKANALAQAAFRLNGLKRRAQQAVEEAQTPREVALALAGFKTAV